MKRSAFLGLLAASSLTVLAATNETDVTWDKENSPYAKAIRAGEAEDWGRFRYWVEMIPENERDSRIRNWMSQLEKKNKPPRTEEKNPPVHKTETAPESSGSIRKSYVGSVTEYVGKSGDSLVVIAYRHGIALRPFKEINGLRDDRLRVGQKFWVPVNVKSKCQVRIAAYTTGKGVSSNRALVNKEYVSVDPAKTLTGGISQYRYYRGNGVFDLLLCSEAASDEMFNVKVTSQNLTATTDVFVQFQEGTRTIEVEVK